MVDVIGHLGMALIWLAPSWFVFDQSRTTATFVATSFWFGLLPDADLYVSNVVPGVHHHGIFHTVVVVTLFAAVLGPALGWILKDLLGGSKWFSWEATDKALGVGFVGVWVAGLSHLFADMLSAPDVSQPIEPLWPLYDSTIVLVDVFYFTSFWATWGLLIVGLAVNVALWYWQAR